MQGPREARRKMNRYRSKAARRGKRNGGTGWLDDFRLEQLLFNSKRNYRREKDKDDGR